MTEIYYTSRITGRAGTVAAWSKAAGFPALLAVALSPNAVGIYTQEARPLDPNNEAIVKNVRGSECSVLAWHPYLPLLAIGWKDGAVSFWNAEERHLEEDSKIHRTTINCVTWNSSGDRLVTGDDNGRISMWKTDRQMRPIHVVSYDEAGCKIKQLVMGPSESYPDTGVTVTVAYYTANSEGRSVIKWANDQGYSGVVQDLTEEVHTLIYYAEKEQMLVVTASCTLNILGKDEQLGTWMSLSKMKFATGTGEAAAGLQVVWAGNHTLASASEKDSMVRMFNFDTEDNYVLSLDLPEQTGNISRVVCLASDDRYGLLSAGTSDGRVWVFKYNAPREGDPIMDFSKCWEAEPPFMVGNRALSMAWGSGPRLMSVVCQDAVNVCRKTMLNHRCRDGFVVIQAAVDKVMVEHVDAQPLKPPGKLKTDMQIMGLDVSKGMLLMYSGTKAELYKITDTNDLVAVSAFDTTAKAMAIINDSIFRTAENRLEVVNQSGVVKQTISFDDSHGSPMLLDINKDYLAAMTSNGTVRVFKVAGRDAKPHAGPGALLPSDHSHFRIDQIRVNGSGTMVAGLASSGENSREATLFVYCSENNSSLVYDFGKEGRLPQAVCWDVIEPKLLGVQTQLIAREDEVDDANSAAGPTLEMACLFVSPDHGVLLQEFQALTPGSSGVIGLAAPNLLLHRKTMVTEPGMQPFSSNVTKLLMQGFAGMSDADDKTKKALLDFSYNLAVGDMDEAFRSVKAIKSNHVWENMAHLCIKNKRLDVADHCLGNMAHSRGARALREAKSIAELDARVAAVAVHLGMLEDAKKLYIAAERYDLLNQLYCACGQWEKALEIAEKNDRIHLKATHYSYAQYLEKAGDLKGALSHYEASGTQNAEAPRMYFEAGAHDELERYIVQHESKELLIWWAHYLESQGQIPAALKCYETAGDSLSIVRIYCYSKDFAAAEEEVSRSGDLATAFHLARQYEAQDRISEAVRYYTLSKRYSHGVRLAKIHQLDSDLMNLALKSTPIVMVDTADYLNERGQYDKAATLYMKGGKLRKAIEMCFGANLFDVLSHITDDLNSDQDPGLYIRCAEFFMQHGHNDKAVNMLIAANQTARALELCVEHDVTITEAMAESMSPDKNAVSAEERNVTLCRIAKVCKRQGSYQLAAKKYTQAGDKVKAMKALLKGGDAEKIIFFAGVSRQKDIFLMAAHYLQTLDWHADAEIMKNIISFYSKAGAVDSLAAFYEACAQIEIDEYRDYEKALQAMREACKQLAKSKSEDRDMRLQSINNRIQLTETFVRARHMITQDPTSALSLCHELLVSIPSEGQDLESGIRVGDVYALMVEYWYEQRNPTEAYKLIEGMRRRDIIISPYLDQRMVQDIYKALGVELPEERRVANGRAPDSPGQMQDNDFVEEDVPEEPEEDGGVY